MEFWDVEEHEVAYSWFRASKMSPGSGDLGSRRARSGLQLAPSMHVWPGNGILGSRRARSRL
eukprot:7581252-Pyramimonas_sp.AAC.1